MRSLCSSTIPYPTGLRNVGAKSEDIIGVGGGNRPSYSERFRETPCADPHAGCCGGWGLDTPGYPISFQSPPASQLTKQALPKALAPRRFRVCKEDFEAEMVKLIGTPPQAVIPKARAPYNSVK